MTAAFAGLRIGARLVVDEDGVRWFYVATLDITDKITYQEELEKSNERLTILAELNNDVLFDANCRLKKTEVSGIRNGSASHGVERLRQTGSAGAVVPGQPR